MEKRIKVAFIGAGYMAEEHIRAFSDINSVELSGIFSRTKQKADNLSYKYDIKNVFNSIDELYETSQSNIVVVAVPELETRKVCSEVFKFPWICLIEKPVGYNIDEATKILEEAKNSNARAYVGLNRRHYSSTRAIVKELKKFEGRRLINVFDQENPIAALEGGQPEEVVKYWMYANSIHIIDYFLTYGRGDILSVEQIIPYDPENPDFVAAKIIFSSGDIGIYEAVWNAPGPWAVSVSTQQRRWESRPLEQVTVQEYKSRKLEQLEKSDWDLNFKPGVRLQAEETIKAVRNEHHLLPSIEEALKSMMLVRDIYD